MINHTATNSSFTESYREAAVALGLAVAAAALIKLPALFGLTMDQNEGFYARNLALFVLPLLTLYFAWKRDLPLRSLSLPGAGFAAALLLVNLYPFAPGGDTEALAALHLPVALWLLVGLAFTGRRWQRPGGRMDFVRFSGEFFIYFVLLALGGGVLTGFMALIYGSIGIDIEPFFETWMLPCGAMGGVIVAAWLVESRHAVMQSMAPLLARLFTPLFALVLVTFLGTVLFTGRGVMLDREVLAAFDLLLVVVLALLLYSTSARQSDAPPGLFDALQVVVLICALLADAVALSAISARISEFGFTPNRVAALGLNILLLVNLGWSAVLYVRFLRGRAPFAALEQWQTAYLPAYAAWAAVVVTVIPLLFGFI